MNEKNKKMLNLLSTILGIPVDKLLDVMISKYMDNMAHNELDKLESALEALEQEEVDTLVHNLIKE